MFHRSLLTRFPRRADRVFVSLWLFIILVSVFDGYLVLTNRMFIAIDEQNPVGRALISWNRGDVWLLLAAKLTGTIFACAVVLVVYWKSERRGLAVAAGIAGFQLILLAYLLG
jgi:hypothetical protein